MAFFKTEEIPHFQADSLKVNYNTLKQAIVLQLFTAFLFRRISEQILHRHLVVDVIGIAALGEAVGDNYDELQVFFVLSSFICFCNSAIVEYKNL